RREHPRSVARHARPRLAGRERLDARRGRRMSARSVLAVSLAVLAGLAHSRGALADPDNAWVSRMDALALSVAKLTPDVLDETPSTDARDARVREQLRVLTVLAHDLSTVDKARRPDTDPTIPLLARELDHAFADATHA